MLQLRTLYAQIGRLRARGFKLGASLLHVHAGSDALIVASVGEIQRFLISDNGGVQQFFLGVDAAQLKIVGSQLRVHTQANGFEIRGAGLRAGDVGRDVIPNASPGIQFIGRVQRQLKIAIRANTLAVRYVR